MRRLGIWIGQTEGARFWMKVFTDLKRRGCQDLLIAVTDGRTGRRRPSDGGWRCATSPLTRLRGARTWKEAINPFAILHEDRCTTPTA
jgi:hypothetical protein